MKFEDVIELHYITDIANVPNILRLGLLPRNKVQHIKHTSIADPNVQDRRKIKKIGERMLHDFVNLYFDAHNPMLSRRRDKNNEICILAVAPIVMKFPGVVITDMNAAADFMRPYGFQAGLAALDKNTIYSTYWKHPEDPAKERLHKLQKCAEVLVPEGISCKYINKAYLANDQASCFVGPARDQVELFDQKGYVLLMNLKILVGDILKSNAQTLINTVNCEGVMGKGIALEFKKHFPDMFKNYVERCTNGDVHLGKPYIYKQLTLPHIINFPTKDHWRSLSHTVDIEEGLDYLSAHLSEWGVTSLAVPPLGCGSGQLEWTVVGPLIFRKLKGLTIPIELYAPYGTKPSELTIDFLSAAPSKRTEHRSASVQSAINPGWIGLLEIIQQTENEPYHTPIGRTIFQKIAYIATRAGLPTGLRYERGSYGPFSMGLKTVQAKLMSGNLMRETRAGQMFMVKTGSSFEKVRREIEPFLRVHAETIEKTKDLFMRMDTAKAEMVSTVIFAADELEKKKNETPSEKEIVGAVMQWKQKRTPPFDPSDVEETVWDLAALGWVKVKSVSGSATHQSQY